MTMGKKEQAKTTMIKSSTSEGWKLSSWWVLLHNTLYSS